MQIEIILKSHRREIATHLSLAFFFFNHSLTTLAQPWQQLKPTHSSYAQMKTNKSQISAVATVSWLDVFYLGSSQMNEVQKHCYRPSVCYFMCRYTVKMVGYNTTKFPPDFSVGILNFSHQIWNLSWH